MSDNTPEELNEDELGQVTGGAGGKGEALAKGKVTDGLRTDKLKVDIKGSEKNGIIHMEEGCTI